MGRSPRDFESRASTSFTTPALCQEQREVTLFYHIWNGVSRVLLVRWSGEERPVFASRNATAHPAPLTITTCALIEYIGLKAQPAMSSGFSTPMHGRLR
jgi:hypothetical protein